MARRTGFVWHEAYVWHDTGGHAGLYRPDGKTVQPDTHAEDPETKRRFRNLLEMTGILDDLVTIKPRPATEDEILRVHTREHLDNIKALSASQAGGDTGILTVVAPGSYEIALLSAGGVIAAVDTVLDGKADNAYALVRPPGHHATRNQAEGFCIFSNAAIAGRHLLESRGLERIAFVDWDVHHGNGTQEAFYSDPRALTISIHQDRFYPSDNGFLEQTGEGAGEGANLNIPMPAGSGVGAYLEAYDKVIIPALKAFEPDFIIIPSGFDAGAMDPLGRIMMHSEGYRQLTQKLLGAADALCGGRLVMCHEGGYSRWTVPYYGLAVMEELSGIHTGTVDPFLEFMQGIGGQEIQPHQAALIAKAVENLTRIPPRAKTGAGAQA